MVNEVKKIAIVIQRYGLEVNGGAELHARFLAERFALIPEYDIEVLTTCALEHTTWENHYPEGVGEVNGIKVRRFAVDKPRNVNRFNDFSKKIFFGGQKNPENEKKWLDDQGPYSPKCVDYIEQNQAEYDVFIFVTYLYYTTVLGMAKVWDKSILVPTAHDEPPIYLDIFKDVFNAPRSIAYNSFEERDFLLRTFNIQHIPGDIVGVGFDIPEDANPTRFREKYGLCDYLLYAGRIESGKNCFVLFDFFTRYKELHPSDLKLVLMGKEIHPVPKHPDIISLGFVSDEDKADGMAGAKLFVLPSLYESLSFVVLESMAVGVPVVVNRKCEVLKGHCIRSNAGLYYDGYHEFEGCVNYLMKHDDVYAAMKINAREYVEANYRWDVVMGKFKKMIEDIAG